MDPLTAALTSIGTGTAAGLRPYLTVLVLSVTGLAIPASATGVIGGVSALPVSIGEGVTTAGTTAVLPSPTLQVARSLGEDLGALGLTVLALLLPLVAAGLGLVLVCLAVVLVLRVRKAVRHRAAPRSSRVPGPPQAPTA